MDASCEVSDGLVYPLPRKNREGGQRHAGLASTGVAVVAIWNGAGLRGGEVKGCPIRSFGHREDIQHIDSAPKQE